jgi:hypothetical protein
MPSVMNFTYVAGEVRSSKRTWYPTSVPTGEPISLATRVATLVAAMRRGWVTPIILWTPRPIARAILGSCVLFPDPVAPATMTTGCSWMAWAMSRTRADMGSSAGKRIGELGSDGGVEAEESPRIREGA